jgi:hypothetical protein
MADQKPHGRQRERLFRWFVERIRGVLHVFAHYVSSPQGFVKRAEGFSPAAGVVRQPAAVGLKPSATATKAAYAAYPQKRATTPYSFSA